MADLFTVVRREDGIIFIDVGDLSPKVLDTWNQFRFKLYKDALQNGRHLRLICDLRDAGWLTQDHLEWVAGSFSEQSSEYTLKRSIAILTDPFTLGLTEQVVGRLPVELKIHTRAFLTEIEAVRWLESRCNGHG